MSAFNSCTACVASFTEFACAAIDADSAALMNASDAFINGTLKLFPFPFAVFLLVPFPFAVFLLVPFPFPFPFILFTTLLRLRLRLWLFEGALYAESSVFLIFTFTLDFVDNWLSK